MKKIVIFTDYLLVYLLVALSGIPFFYKSGLIFLLGATMLSFVVFVYRRKSLDMHSFLFLSAMFIVLYAQTIKFELFPFTTYLGIYLRIFLAFFTIKAVGKNFFKVFINILVASSIISFFFFFPSFIPGIEKALIAISPSFDTPFRDPTAIYIYNPSIIVYTINTAGNPFVLRNSGPFWEPGAFGGFLIIGLMFNLIINKTFFNKSGRYMLFALLTTFSTTAYTSFFLLILFFILVKADMIYKVILVPLIIAISVFAFTSIDFLGDKITSKADIKGNTYNTRFTSAMLDLEDTYENPFWGLGRSTVTRFKGSMDPKQNHRNNGTTSFLVEYGIPFFVFYLYFVFLGFKKLCEANFISPIFGFYLVILILVMGFSEMYFNYPFFFGLALLKPIIEDESFELENQLEQT